MKKQVNQRSGSSIGRVCIKIKAKKPRDVEALAGALFASEHIDETASYLQRGRRFGHYDVTALNTSWIEELRRALSWKFPLSAKAIDIAAELSLRGIKNVEFPPNVKKAFDLECKAMLKVRHEISVMLLEEINEFEYIIGQQNN
jgi:hypothetical protein